MWNRILGRGKVWQEKGQSMLGTVRSLRVGPKLWAHTAIHTYVCRRETVSWTGLTSP